jgi:tryptophanyl-tRNA synthetase
MRSKMLSLSDNRLKISTSNKRNRLEFFDETNKNKKKLRTIHKNCQLTRLRFYHNNKYWPLLGGYTF